MNLPLKHLGTINIHKPTRGWLKKITTKPPINMALLGFVSTTRRTLMLELLEWVPFQVPWGEIRNELWQAAFYISTRVTRGTKDWLLHVITVDDWVYWVNGLASIFTEIWKTSEWCPIQKTIYFHTFMVGLPYVNLLEGSWRGNPKTIQVFRWLDNFRVEMGVPHLRKPNGFIWTLGARRSDYHPFSDVHCNYWIYRMFGTQIVGWMGMIPHPSQANMAKSTVQAI